MEKLKEKSVKLYTQEVYDNTMKVKVAKLKDGVCWKEFDKWMHELGKKNGTTNY